MTGADDADRDAERGDAEVGDRLRRLFDDTALGAVRAPDPDAVVAGARRRRRRRATAGACAGVVVTLGVVAGGLVLSGAGGRPGPDDITAADSSGPIARSTDVSVPRDPSRPVDEVPPPGLTTVESPPGTAPTSLPRTAPPNRSALPPSMRPSSAGSTVAERPERLPLGVSGQEPLTLLMTYDEAVATGAMDPGDGPPAQGRCRAYDVSGPGISQVAIRGGHGIVRFQAGDSPTPEGIGVGSPVSELNRAYPESERRGEQQRVRSNPDADSEYVFGVGGDRVTTLRLTVPDPEVSC